MRISLLTTSVLLAAGMSVTSGCTIGSSSGTTPTAAAQPSSTTPPVMPTPQMGFPDPGPGAGPDQIDGPAMASPDGPNFLGRTVSEASGATLGVGGVVNAVGSGFTALAEIEGNPFVNTPRGLADVVASVADAADSLSLSLGGGLGQLGVANNPDVLGATLGAVPSLVGDVGGIVVSVGQLLSGLGQDEAAINPVGEFGPLNLLLNSAGQLNGALPDGNDGSLSGVVQAVGGLLQQGESPLAEGVTALGVGTGPLSDGLATVTNALEEGTQTLGDTTGLGPVGAELIGNVGALVGLAGQGLGAAGVPGITDLGITVSALGSTVSALGGALTNGSGESGVLGLLLDPLRQGIEAFSSQATIGQ